MSGGAARYAKGVLVGVACLAVALAFAWAASSDRSPVSWVAPYAFFITLAWWVAITLGVAAGISSADRVSAGVVVGVLAVPLMVVSMGLMQRISLADAFSQWGLWQSALLTTAAPWLFGTGFGWSVLHHRRRLEGQARL